LDKLLENKIYKEEAKQENDIQALIEQLKKTEITPQKDRLRKKDKAWTFFQTGTEVSKKEGPVSLKID